MFCFFCKRSNYVPREHIRTWIEEAFSSLSSENDPREEGRGKKGAAGTRPWPETRGRRSGSHVCPCGVSGTLSCGDLDGWPWGDCDGVLDSAEPPTGRGNTGRGGGPHLHRWGEAPEPAGRGQASGRRMDYAVRSEKGTCVQGHGGRARGPCAGCGEVATGTSSRWPVAARGSRRELRGAAPRTRVTPQGADSLRLREGGAPGPREVRGPRRAVPCTSVP